MLEELDAGFKKATPYLDEAMIKRYNEQRTAGHFDTKLRVNATMQYFNQMIKEGKDVGKDKKDAK